MRTTMILCAIVVAAVAITGCNEDKIKQLNDQVAALGSDNTTLKAKIGDLEKARAEMEVKLGVLQSDRDQTKKALEECTAKVGDKGDKPKGADKPKVENKGTDTKGGGSHAAAPAKKPVFKAPKKSK